MKQALHIKNLTKKYKDFTLDHISLDLPYGMILGLIGENGSGKSTLINSILNIVKADYDEVHILGQDLKSQEKEIKKEIAVIFNDSHYGENLTPLFIGKMLSGIYTDWDQKKFTDYLKQVHLPENKPTYLMGVGTPANILEAVDRGVDFFDCVYTSRNGRHGHVYTNNGKMNLFNAKYELDDRPIEEGCGCPACRSYSRAYIRHLLKAKEMLGMRLCVLHNLYFYNTMMEEIREAIEAGEYKAYKKRKLEGMMQ